MNSMLKEQSYSYLFGSNADFVEGIYESYLEDPKNVDGKWRKYFDSIQDGKVADSIHSNIRDKFALLTQNSVFTTVSSTEINQAQAKVWQLIDNYRMLGVESADLDPLKRVSVVKADILDIKKLGLDSELENEFYIDFNLQDSKKLKLKDIIAKFDALYCTTVGFEYTYITDVNEREWIKNYIETKLQEFSLDKDAKKHLLEKLTESDGLERFLNTKFVGVKRFSLEGGDSLIPALDRLINNLASLGTEELYIGMAHRGRLNVLVNINGKTPEKLYTEFEGNYKFAEFVTSGDVKYHKGYKCNYITNNGAVKVTTLYNPSHLEVINPVLNGAVRARQDATATGNNVNKITGVVIHGDSALIGLGTNQGVFNMSHTRSCGVGGLIHIVINNQVGFTTSDVRDTRSSRFCTDLAKMVEAPVMHVNADDVERVAFVIDLATEYRRIFKKDIMIDLICFRRHGHNEADDPTLTQPLMYRKVKAHPGTRKLYADKLISENILTQNDVDNIFETFRTALADGKHTNKDKMIPLPMYENFNLKPLLSAKPFDIVKTAITKQEVAKITDIVTTLPNSNFKLHPTIQRTVIEPRKQMGAGVQAIDFGMAETLAYGSLLNNGVSVRICGEDSGRGTFSHRHAVWHNFERIDIADTGYIPLKKLENDSKIDIFDSVLNEECALGFEYGYSITSLRNFVMWEAQFGDFANGSQVMIDQFIASCEAKWGVLCNLTMMLPHGYDGQGPEHSSARLERFLQLCAENNLQVVMPSTAAQMFHLIRRKGLNNYIKPLVILMSKRLLRYKDAASDLSEITHSEFKFVIGDNIVQITSVDKVLLCSGQVYYDLLNERKACNLDSSVAIVRVEQLYPFPVEQLKAELSKYKDKKVFWVQEEPHNQGAWMQIRDYLDMVAGQKVKAISRDASAAPACGLPSTHNAQLKQILKNAFEAIN
ncbi:MAG: 2-oxoglutarate dehydrogenase E1 component [Burkholderiales bacterium]|nr:2-oxoglutarate dehydrogenase E1 component [Burkholderiales bacterium]